MSPRARKLLGLAAAVVGLVLAVLGIALVWLLGTESGLRFAVAAARPRLPVALTIERVHGRIWGDMRFEGIQAASEAVSFSAERFELAWDPWALFGRRVHVRRLVLDGPRILLAAHPPAPADSTRAMEPVDFELPVRVLVDTLRVHRLVLAQQGLADSFLVSEIALDGLQYRDSLGVQRFALATPWGELQFAGWVRTRGEYPIDLSLQWSLRPPELPVVIGFGALTGDLRELIVRQHVTAPVEVFAEARLFELTRALRFEASARAAPFPLRALKADAPALRVGGQVGASGDWTRLTARAAARVASVEFGDWDLSAELSRDGTRVDLRSLVAALRGGSSRIEASGTTSLDSASAPLHLVSRWRHLRWPLTGEAVVGAPSGTLTVEGVPASWALELESEVLAKGSPTERLSARGHGDTTSFTLDALAGSLLGGEVDARGRVAWAPEIEWDLDAVTRGVDPGLLAPQWPGDLGFRLSTAGRWTDSTWAARLDLGELGGHLRGQPVSGAARFAGRHDTTSVLDLRLRYGDAALEASGSVRAPIALAWRLEAPALSVVDSSWSGGLIASGSLQGRDTVEVLEVRVSGNELSIPGVAVRSVVLDAHLDRPRGDEVAMHVVSRGLQVAATPPFDSLVVDLRGARGGYRVEGVLQGPRRRLELAAGASFSDSTWTGAIERLALVAGDHAPWDLEGPVPFMATPSRAWLGSLRSRSGESSLALEGSWDAATGVQAKADLRQLRLADLNPYLPPEWRVEGALTATMQLEAKPDGILLADARLEPASGQVVWKSDREVTVRFENARLDLHSDATSLRLDSGVRLADLGDLAMQLELPGFRWTRLDSSQTLTGGLDAEISRWDLVEELSPDVENARGTLTAEVRFAGTLTSQSLTGRAELKDGALDLPALGLEIRDARLAAESEAGKRWKISGSARSDTGQVALEASADLSETRRPRASMRLRGERFLLLDSFDSRVLVSPDLEARLDGARLDLTGELTVPSARIDAGDRKLALAVPPSQDVVVLRAAADTTRPPLDLYTRVRLTLGDDVHFSGYGLTAKPEGSLLVVQEPDKPALGQGELSITEGTYTGYGRELTIERGRFLYAGGPVDDPEVDIRASREIERDDVIAGFEITGTLKKSNLTVFSDPEMSQSDAISYILFGRPLAEAKSSESAIARETATAMGLQAGSAYTQKLASKFGLDEASLESEGTMQQASLMLGTYLTPSLYARYGVGLFSSANTFELQYFLNRNWTLEAKTAEENSAGIIYSIEP